MSALAKYITNLGRWLTQGINTITGGDPDEYFCSRIGKAQRGDFGKVAAVITTPFRFVIDMMLPPYGGIGHCAHSIEEDEGKDELLFRLKDKSSVT